MRRAGVPTAASLTRVLAGSFVYLVAALKRIFGGSTLRTVLRAAAVAVAYLTLLVATTAVLILLTFYRLGSVA